MPPATTTAVMTKSKPGAGRFARLRVTKMSTARKTIAAAAMKTANRARSFMDGRSSPSWENSLLAPSLKQQRPIRPAEAEGIGHRVFERRLPRVVRDEVHDEIGRAHV